MEEFISTWYDWGVFVGVFIAAAIAIYIFFDSQQAAPGAATLPRLVSIAGVLLTLPSLYYRLTLAEQIIEDLALDENNLELFFYLALGGLALGALALIYYLMRARNSYVEPAPVMPMPVQAAPPPPPPAPRVLPPTMPVDQEPPVMAWLVVRRGPRVGAQFGLGRSQPNIIGRDPTKADIIIDEDSVSREHARVRFEDGQFILYDMASTGGTYVNGNMVQRQMLYDDDLIRLGRVELAFKKV